MTQPFKLVPRRQYVVILTDGDDLPEVIGPFETEMQGALYLAGAGIGGTVVTLDRPPLLAHTVRGKAIGPEGSPYGVTHDYECPACVASGASFTTSPRSETYWSS